MRISWDARPVLADGLATEVPHQQLMFIETGQAHLSEPSLLSLL